MTSNYRGDIREAFKPEFLNRVDEIVYFRELTEADLASIVDIQLRELDKRLASRRLDLVVTNPAEAWLARRGYDPVYGARPLKRLIQRTIGDPLALALLKGDYNDGDTVTVDVAESSAAPTATSEPAADGAVTELVLR
jgi:ATP-dependent Clp protease ATP-binding subunit ClpB